eukprot:CAMPEP_0173394452 /NCGR_PEP_ID=MMETSP1356-20130122/27434_1 /TAXON_ID=77927 ORGANISM="Hemiselmis virescens, Strain PCC157" /NCGR_SAMPLE_ID=MMETSP1356 /ASSEMBLY_ACC=CAM_ASM_000847 /LENGTH=61 /DNA_ID=CAMNT_0014352811 /DNA_START=24 /DNA_END=209 /DNA_ORIENTATION=-
MALLVREEHACTHHASQDNDPGDKRDQARLSLLHVGDVVAPQVAAKPPLRVVVAVVLYPDP